VRILEPLVINERSSKKPANLPVLTQQCLTHNTPPAFFKLGDKRGYTSYVFQVIIPAPKPINNKKNSPPIESFKTLFKTNDYKG